MKVAGGAALAIVVVLGLTGCAGAAAPSDTPVAESTPSPTPTPSETAADPGVVQDPADPSTWIISAAGIGPVQIGDSLTAALAAATAYSDVTDRDACPNTLVTFAGSAGKTTADAEMLILTDESGTVIGVTTSDPTTKTAEGIHAGDSLDAVSAAYPDGEATKRYKPGDQWTVTGDPGWISYTVFGDGGVSMVSVIENGTPPYEFCG